MPAIVYVGEGAIEVQRVDVPDLGPGQVRIAVSHCGICGTDLHMVLEQMARPGSGLGHEWAGTIEAVGEGVTDWAPGDRVVAGPGPGCGECRACRRGRPSVCLNRPAMPEPTGHRGAFAQYTTVPAERLLRIPEGLSTRAAALTEPTAIAQHAITLSGVTPEDRVLVTGAGPVGMLVTAVLHAQGIHDITVSEPAAARREHDAQGRCGTRDHARRAPAPQARWPRRASRTRSCSSAPVAVRAAEAESRPARLRGHVRVRGHVNDVSPRQSQPGDHLRGARSSARTTTTLRGEAPALELLASGKMPLDELIEPVDVLLDGPLRRDATVRARGELPGKVMITAREYPRG